MEAVRRVLAIVLVIGMPPAVTFWLLLHPLASFWRRLGPGWAYTILAGAEIALAGFLFLLRDTLVGRDLGTRWPLIVAGVVLYVGSLWLSVLTKRQLHMRVFAGVPEVSSGTYPGRLLQGGVYAVIRHPRYASVMLGTIGFGLAVNCAGSYVVVGISLLLLWPVIVLEERELAARFGAEYDTYRRRTPALLPRGRPRRSPRT
jgi:protein-S-isoprenylcysteine O-methyltransferase Ste14